MSKNKLIFKSHDAIHLVSYEHAREIFELLNNNGYSPMGRDRYSMQNYELHKDETCIVPAQRAIITRTRAIKDKLKFIEL